MTTFISLQVEYSFSEMWGFTITFSTLKRHTKVYQGGLFMSPSSQYNHTQDTQANNIKLYLQGFTLDQYTVRMRLYFNIIMLLLIPFKTGYIKD